jgi:PiT family inorganic phosphate transporter
MGIITATPVAAGYLKGLTTPTWVIFAAHAAIALGTMSGGWRIVPTMCGRLTRLKPRSGFCAETGAAFSVLLATGYFHLPVSTMHAIAGAIVGVGAINRVKAVRWGFAANIVWAWVLTIPVSAIVASPTK